MALANYREFRAEIRKQLSLRGWKYKDLSAATGYTVKTIEAFMCGTRVTDSMAISIAKALNIPEHYAT